MPGACLLLWKVPARPRLHLKTAKMVLVASPTLSRSQVGVHSWVGSGLPRLPSSILGFCLLTRPKDAWGCRTFSTNPCPPSTPSPFTLSELSPDLVNLPWDETVLGVVCPFRPHPGNC